MKEEIVLSVKNFIKRDKIRGDFEKKTVQRKKNEKNGKRKRNREFYLFIYFFLFLVTQNFYVLIGILKDNTTFEIFLD